VRDEGSRVEVVRTGYRMDWGGVRAEVDRSDLEGVEDIQKPAYVVGVGVADYIHFYCCQAPGKVSEVFNLLRDLQVKKRADERTRTADLLITSALLTREGAAADASLLIVSRWRTR
jgi:hypothetical protein